MLLLMALTAWSFETRTGDEVIVPAEELVVGDLYLAGDRVVVDGRVDGDLLALGRQVIVRGTVAGDLLVLGRQITVDGEVGDDARLAGQDVTLGRHAAIGDELLLGAATGRALPGSHVQGPLVGGVGELLLEGRVGGLELFGRAVEIEGEVAGPARLHLEYDPEDAAVWGPSRPRPGLTVSSEARLAGPLELEAPSPARLPATPLDLDVTYTPIPGLTGAPRGGLARALAALRQLVSLLVVGGLVAWVLPERLTRSIETLRDRPGASLGTGALSLLSAVLLGGMTAVVTGIVTGLLAASSLTLLAGVALGTGGLLLGGLALAATVGVVFLGQIVFAVFLGERALELVLAEGPRGRLGALLLGATGLVVLTSLPGVGGVIGLVASFLGLGAALLALAGRPVPNLAPVLPKPST